MIDTDFLCKSRLFQGFTEEEIKSLLECLNASSKTYKKGEYIFQTGEITENFGMILDGKVQIISDDYWGNARFWQDLEKDSFSAKHTHVWKKCLF